MESIRERRSADEQKKITEKQLIEEYTKLYFQIPDDDKMKQLIHQPGLLQADLDHIAEVTG